MPSSRQRIWKSQIQQHALLEYGLVKRACPPGIYLSLTPDNHALWSGVLFVRKGPYSPAVLRFQVAFPQRYPEVPPLVLFTSDVFHPLITPLTTYTYTTGSKATDPVSATDEGRLLPGGLSLQHGFPGWFEKVRKPSPAPLMFKDQRSPSRDRNDAVDSDEDSTRPSSPQKMTVPVHMPPPKDEGNSLKDLSPSIIEVLRYIKRVFEEDSLLDDLPLEVAGNPGAWNAWQAHRRKTRPAKLSAESSKTRQQSPKKGNDTPGRTRSSGQWNWDGVWVERVKRCINSSLSEPILYGGVDGDDLIQFLDLEDAAIDTLREKFNPTEEVKDEAVDNVSPSMPDSRPAP